MSLSTEHEAAMAALGAGGALPPKPNTIPAENRTLSCHPGCALETFLKCVSRKSPSKGRRAMCRLSWISKPAPNIVANTFSEPRGVQIALPEQPEIVTELACVAPNSAWANGV